MVNYLYDLGDIEKNHEAFAEEGRRSRPRPPSQKHLKTGPRPRARATAHAEDKLEGGPIS